jgi:hypothetical protein
LTDGEKWARDIGIVSPHHPPKSLCDAYLESSWYKDTSKKQTGNRREIAKEFFLGRDSLAEVFARRGQRRDNNGAQLNDAEKKPGFLADYFASRCR